MEVIKGYLIKTIENGTRAQVETATGKIIDNVLMYYSYGYASNMESENNAGSMVLLLLPNKSSTNAIGFPYNPLFQPNDLEPSEVTVGNLKRGCNKITFKANGDIVVDCQNNVTINGSTINLGDASSLVLNENADLSVTIPSGSSAGTYTVDINAAGQTKVNA